MNEITTTVQGYAVKSSGHISKTVQALQALIQWRNRYIDSPDYWLREIVCTAFQRMKSRMPDAPGADVITCVAEDWVDILGDLLNDEELDRERALTGFKILYRECSRFPQPNELLKRLPTRIRKPIKTAVEAPLSDEAYERGKAAFQDILSMLNME